MTRGRWLMAVAMMALLAAPVAAQGGRGHARGGGLAWSGGRQAAPRPAPRGGQIGRSSGRRAEAPRGPSSARAPRPAVQGPGVRSAGRTVQPMPPAGRRYVEPVYRGRSVVGHAVPRPFVQQEFGVPGRGGARYGGPAHGPRYPHARPYGYQLHYRYAPRYVAPGWRGGWGSHVIVVPRHVHPYVVRFAPWHPYFYRPSIGIGVYYGAGGFYPFGAVPPVYYDPAPQAVLGGVRIVDAPRDAQVFVDGAYAGIVDDFDGAGEHLNLEPGLHRIEIHTPASEAVAFDVDVQPGRTITLRVGAF